MKQIIKHLKQWEKHLHAANSTENAEENAVRHSLARRTKIFKIFNTVAEKFYPRINIFGWTIFFLSPKAKGNLLESNRVGHYIF